MAKVTEHAKENMRVFAKVVGQVKADALKAKVAEVIHTNVESIAVVVALDKPVANPIRDDWKLNDRLVAIIRNQQVRTVMLSRKEQIHKSHLRTEVISLVA